MSNNKVFKSILNLVDYIQINFESKDIGKLLTGFFYLKAGKELVPKGSVTSHNWKGRVEIAGNIPVLHLTRIAGVWIDLMANINRGIKTVQFFVPDMGEVRVTFNFR